jgi:flagellar hook-associated protein 3
MSGTLNSIYSNVSFALHLHSEAMARLQEQASTGSRINRVSDDPSTAHRVLGLNSRQRSFENYIDNLLEVVGKLEVSSTVIGEITSALTETKTRISQISSGIYNQDARERTAEGINDILEQIISLANTKHMGQYLFGGDNTNSVPYVVERTNGRITSVTYQGGSENRNVEVAPGVESSAFHVGNIIFASNDRGDPIFIGDTGAKAGTGTANVRGNTWLTVTGSTGNYTLSIDDGLNTFDTNGTDTNLTVTNPATGEVLYVDTREINGTGVELISVPGTYDVFDTLIGIRDTLTNERGLSEAQLADMRNSMLDSLEEIRSHIVGKSVSVGARIGFLEDIKNSLENIKFDTEDETTRLQEADIAQIAIDLSRREILYQMSLSVAGKLMSVSLLDFLQ